MTEDNGQEFPSATDETPEEDVTHIPNAVGPDCEFAISPQGLIRSAFSQGVIMSAFYTDAAAAREISRQFAEAADRLDEAWEQLRLLQVQAEDAAQDTQEVDLSIQDAKFVVEEPVEEIDEESAN